MLHTGLGILLVANATSLGWGLRGEWGHWWGATVPGALCGMALWIVFGGSEDPWQMLAYGSVLALAFSIGGTQSYGLILGYATCEKGAERSPLFGLFGLFLVGGLWGFWGGAALGLLTTERSYLLADLALCAILASIGAFLGYKLLVPGLDLHLSPPRSDAWAAVLGGAAATTAYFLLVAKDYSPISHALAGWVGFGGGFSLSAFVHRRGEEAGWHFSSWKFIEHGLGFFGGLSLATSCALTGDRLPSFELGATTKMSILLVLWFITYMVLSNNFEHWSLEVHWLSRRAFSLFQGASLVSLLILMCSASEILGRLPSPSAWQAKAILLFFLSLFTAIGTLKFLHRWSDVRSRVVATFAIQFLICVVLLLLL